jgi:hypothetical protein
MSSRRRQHAVEYLAPVLLPRAIRNRSNALRGDKLQTRYARGIRNTSNALRGDKLQKFGGAEYVATNCSSRDGYRSDFSVLRAAREFFRLLPL